MSERWQMAIIDYRAEPDSQRRMAHVLNALPEAEVAVTLVSAGDALDRLRSLADHLIRPVKIAHCPATEHRLAIAEGDKARTMTRLIVEIAAPAWAERALLWFPSILGHLADGVLLARSVVTLPRHDDVLCGEMMAARLGPLDGAVQTGVTALADLILRRVWHSAARLVVPTDSLARQLIADYGPPLRPPAVIDMPSVPVTRDLAEPIADLFLPPNFLLCAADLSPLQDHETLLRALAGLKAQSAENFLPLVLLGAGTDQLKAPQSYRAAYLAGLLTHLGLTLGQDVIALGELNAGRRRTVTDRAALSLVTALSDCAGRSAVSDGLALGVPLALADSPGRREQLDRRGDEAHWFAPGDSDALAALLTRLAPDLDDLKARAALTAQGMTDPSWRQMADDYLAIFRDAAPTGSPVAPTVGD